MNISVVLALYNGEQWILEQVESILKQLEKGDELLVVDDCSTDGSINLVASLSSDQIKILKNDKNIGHVQAFFKGIKNAKNDIIFLSDQDDIWFDRRIALMKRNLIQKGADLLVTQYSLVASKRLKSIDSKVKGSIYLLSDIIFGRNKYFGCTYVFKKSSFTTMELPKWVLSHDLAIVLFSALKNKVVLYSENATLYRRIHDNNLTAKRTSLLKKIKNRLWMLRFLALAQRTF